MTPTVDLELIGSSGPVAVTAILDTGFDDHLCLPIRFAVTLGLTLIGTDTIELADGTQKTGVRVFWTNSVSGQEAKSPHFLDRE